MIEVPCVPRKRELRPAITSAAMRPWRFAGPASATRLRSPVTKSLTSTASPTAKMSGSLVRMCSSTRMPPRSPIASPADLGERRVGTHAEREDHDVRRILLAGLRLHFDRAAFQLLESGDAVVERQAHAMPLHVLLDQARELAIERSEELIEHLDQRHLESGMDQVLRGLEADEAAADDDGSPRRPHELDARVAVHAREELRAALDPFADGP